MKSGKTADHIILGVHITQRTVHAEEVQKVLTAFGCQIKTRLGLHDTGRDFCSPNGLILLEVTGGARDAAGLVRALRRIAGVDVQKMVFAH